MALTNMGFKTKKLVSFGERPKHKGRGKEEEEEEEKEKKKRREEEIRRSKAKKVWNY